MITPTKNRRKGGIVNDLVNGVGGLIILVVVTLIIVSTILGANLLKGSVGTTTVFNETVILNSSDSIPVLTNWTADYHDFSILAVYNESGAEEIIPTTNYTFSSLTGEITNATEHINLAVNVTYSYMKTNAYEESANGMRSNFTTGLGNVSTKLPTILLIAAVVLLFGVLVVLIARAKQMGIGSANGEL